MEIGMGSGNFFVLPNKLPMELIWYSHTNWKWKHFHFATPENSWFWCFFFFLQIFFLKKMKIHNDSIPSQMNMKHHLLMCTRKKILSGLNTNAQYSICRVSQLFTCANGRICVFVFQRILYENSTSFFLVIHLSHSHIYAANVCVCLCVCVDCAHWPHIPQNR